MITHQHVQDIPSRLRDQKSQESHCKIIFKYPPRKKLDMQSDLKSFCFPEGYTPYKEFFENDGFKFQLYNPKQFQATKNKVGEGYVSVNDKEAIDTMVDTDRWLRTGNLCYFDNEGFLFVVDRLKELVKYKDYQVFLELWTRLIRLLPNSAEESEQFNELAGVLDVLERQHASKATCFKGSCPILKSYTMGMAYNSEYPLGGSGEVDDAYKGS